MKVNLIIAFFILVLSLFSNGKVIKIWDETEKLKWEDFKNKFNKPTPSGATSFIYFDYSPALLNEDSVKIIIQAKFDTFESWYNPNDTSNYALAHEQLHFDIAEMFARRFRQEMSTFDDSLSYIVLLKELQKRYTVLYAECNSYQDEYDLETNHSINSTAQQIWNKTISTRLQELQGFQFQTITLKLKSNR